MIPLTGPTKNGTFKRGIAATRPGKFANVPPVMQAKTAPTRKEMTPTAENPDLIFIHDAHRTCLSYLKVVDYVRHHESCALLGDIHNDFYNSNVEEEKKKSPVRKLYNHLINGYFKKLGDEIDRCIFKDEKVYSLEENEIPIIRMINDMCTIT